MSGVDDLSGRLVLTLEEVAEIIGVTARTPGERRRQVRELIEAGELRPVTRTVGPQRWRVSTWEVRRFLGDPDCHRPA